MSLEYNDFLKKISSRQELTEIQRKLYQEIGLYICGTDTIEHKKFPGKLSTPKGIANLTLSEADQFFNMIENDFDYTKMRVDQNRRRHDVIFQLSDLQMKLAMEAAKTWKFAKKPEEQKSGSQEKNRERAQSPSSLKKLEALASSQKTWDPPVIPAKERKTLITHRALDKERARKIEKESDKSVKKEKEKSSKKFTPAASAAKGAASLATSAAGKVAKGIAKIKKPKGPGKGSTGHKE